MEKRIALFFDIDGTLFDNKTKSVLPSTKHLLELLHKKPNYDLYLSTGRSYDTLGTLKDYLKYFRGFNLSNGQEIYLDDQKFYGPIFDRKTLSNFLEFAKKNNHSVGIISKEKIEMNFFTDKSYQNFTSYIKKEVDNLDHKPYDLNKEVIQLWLFCENEEIKKYLDLFPNLSILNWGYYGADVLPNHSSKARGIKHLQTLMGYETANMYAFGDGDKDVKMFEVVGTSIAMGNGSMLAKEAATLICDDISNDGLYKACVKLKLI